MASGLNKGRKRGIASVEMALVLLLLVIFTFGVMEYGWMFYRMAQVTNCAHAGARLGVLPDASSADVNTLVGAMLSNYDLDGSFSVTITPADVSTAEAGDLVQVRVQVTYQGSADLLGMSLFPTPAHLAASTSMAKEGPE